MKTSPKVLFGASLYAGALLFLSAPYTYAQQGAHLGTPQVIFDDALRNGWDNWSWAKNVLDNPAPARGARSMRVQAGPWTAIYWHHEAFDTAPFESLNFWVHGGDSGGQKLRVMGLRGAKPVGELALEPLTAKEWRQVTVPLAKIGVENVLDCDGFYVQEAEGKEIPAFFVDDFRLVARTGKSPEAPVATPVVLRLDAKAQGHTVSPLIYGLNAMDGDIAGTLNELNAPINRWGGNAVTRYNWQQNASNRASDWFFQSIGSDSATPGADADRFIAQTRQANADAMLTIPLIGWVAKVGPKREKLASFSVAKYGAQKSTDAQWFADAGNGLKPDGTHVTGNDPNDANLKVDGAWMQGWFDHLKAKGTPRYYLLDNEAALWHETHRDVKPQGFTLREMRDLVIEYGTRIRKTDPNALIVGPEEWGWLGYKYSGADFQRATRTNNWSEFPDRKANGDRDYIPWLLSELKAHEKRTGTRLLDVLSVHYYPQGGEFGDDLSPQMQLKRNRSTRSLWDENWVDESWIKEKIALLPRLKKWRQEADPTLKLAITEYNWGAEGHISGALAQAEVLGIFGREGLDIATRWTAPRRDSPVWNAIKLLRNYDGKKSAFGNKSLPLTPPDPDTLSAFAARRSSDGTLTILVLNKRLNERAPLRLQIDGLGASGADAQTAQHYQLTARNVLSKEPDISVRANLLEITLPPQSLNLFVLGKTGP